MIIVNGIEYKPTNKNDGTPAMRNVPKPGAFSTQVNIDWCFDDISELVIVGMLIAHYRDRFTSRIALNVPYLPYGNYDCEYLSGFWNKDSNCCTAKYLMRIINSFGADDIRVFDAHHIVVEGFLDRSNNTIPHASIKKAIDESKPDAIFYPQGEMATRYGIFFEKSEEDGNIPVVVGMESLQNMWNKKVLIIMDILYDNDELERMLGAILSAGAKTIDIYASHCAASVLDCDTFATDEIKHLFTTDSLLDIEHTALPKSTEEKIVLVEQWRKCKCRTVTDEMRKVV